MIDDQYAVEILFEARGIARVMRAMMRVLKIHSSGPEAWHELGVDEELVDEVETDGHRHTKG